MPGLWSQPQDGKRHYAGRHRSAYTSDFGSTQIDLLMYGNLAQHTLGQGAIDRHYHTILLRPDETHRTSGADQKVRCVNALTAMTVGVRQPGPAQCPRRHPNQSLLCNA